MNQKRLLLCVAVALMLSVFVMDAAPVSAIPLPPEPPTRPAAGAWIVSDKDAIEELIPQFQLEAPTGGYALLQSDAVQVSVYTRICHPYRGGQYGWTSEIRALTAAGWSAVPTENGWEPDEEGQYMTCAEVGRGTYAVFGYWNRPAWWQMCPPAGYTEFVMDIRWHADPLARCGANGTIILGNGTEIDLTGIVYCCNYSVYWADDFISAPFE